MLRGLHLAFLVVAVLHALTAPLGCDAAALTVQRVAPIADGAVFSLANGTAVTTTRTLFSVPRLGAGSTLLISKLASLVPGGGAPPSLIFNVSAAAHNSRIVFDGSVDFIENGVYLVVAPETDADVVHVEFQRGARIGCKHFEASGLVCGPRGIAVESQSVNTARFATALRIEVAPPPPAATASQQRTHRGQVNISLSGVTVALAGPSDARFSAGAVGAGTSFAAILVTPSRNDVPGSELPLVNLTLRDGCRVQTTGFVDKQVAIGVAVGAGAALAHSTMVGTEYDSDNTGIWWDAVPNTRRPWNQTQVRQALATGNASSLQFMPLGRVVLQAASVWVESPSTNGKGVALGNAVFVPSSPSAAAAAAAAASVVVPPTEAARGGAHNFSSGLLIDRCVINATSTATSSSAYLQMHCVSVAQVDGGGEWLSRAALLPNDPRQWRRVPGFDIFETRSDTDTRLVNYSNLGGNSSNTSSSGVDDDDSGAVPVVPADAPWRTLIPRGAHIVVLDTTFTSSVRNGQGSENKHKTEEEASGMYLVAADFFASLQLHRVRGSARVYVGMTAPGVHAVLVRHLGLWLARDSHFDSWSEGGDRFVAVYARRVAYVLAIVWEHCSYVVDQKPGMQGAAGEVWCTVNRRSNCGAITFSTITVRFGGYISSRFIRLRLQSEASQLSYALYNCSFVDRFDVRNHEVLLSPSFLGAFFNILASRMHDLGRIDMENVSLRVEMLPDYGNVAVALMVTNATAYVGTFSVRNVHFHIASGAPAQTQLLMLQLGNAGPRRYIFDSIALSSPDNLFLAMLVGIGSPWIGDATRTGEQQAAAFGVAEMRITRITANFSAALFGFLWCSVARPSGDGWESSDLQQLMNPANVYRGAIAWVSNVDVRHCTITCTRIAGPMFIPFVTPAFIVFQDAGIANLTLRHNRFTQLDPNNGQGSVPFASTLMPQQSRPLGETAGTLDISRAPCNVYNGAPVVSGMIARGPTKNPSNVFFGSAPLPRANGAALVDRECGGSETASESLSRTFYVPWRRTRTETNRSHTRTRNATRSVSASGSAELPPVDASGAPPAAQSISAVAGVASLAGGAGASVALDASRALSVLALAQQCGNYWATQQDVRDAEQRDITFVRTYLLFKPSSPENFFGIGIGQPVGRYIRGAIVSHMVLLLISCCIALILGAWTFFSERPTWTPAERLRTNAFFYVLRAARLPLLVGKTFCFVLGAWTTHSVVLMAAPRALELPTGDTMFFGVVSILLWAGVAGGIFAVFWRCVDVTPRRWQTEEFLLQFGWRDRAIAAHDDAASKQQRRPDGGNARRRAATSKNGAPPSTMHFVPSAEAAAAAEGSSSNGSSDEVAAAAVAVSRPTSARTTPRNGGGGGSKPASPGTSARPSPSTTPRQQQQQQQQRPQSGSRSGRNRSSSSSRKKPPAPVEVHVDPLLAQTCKWRFFSAVERLLRSPAGNWFAIGYHCWTEVDPSSAAQPGSSSSASPQSRAQLSPRTESMNASGGAVKRQSASVTTTNSVVMGRPDGALRQCGGLVSKQCGPVVEERFLSYRSRAERDRAPEYERATLGGEPTRRFYYTSRLKNGDPAAAWWWDRLPLLRITPYYVFISMAWTFANALAQAIAVATPSRCVDSLIAMAVINSLALAVDVLLRPFAAPFRNITAILSSFFIAIGSVLAAAAVAAAAARSKEDSAGGAAAATAGGSSGLEAAAKAASNSDAALVAAAVGLLVTSLVTGLLISLTNLFFKLLLSICQVEVLLRRDVLQRMQQVRLHHQHHTVDSLITGAEEMTSSVSLFASANGSGRARAAQAKGLAGGVEAGGIAGLAQTFL